MATAEPGPREQRLLEVVQEMFTQSNQRPASLDDALDPAGTFGIQSSDVAMGYAMRLARAALTMTREFARELDRRETESTG